jgi:hypothetical protein
MAKEFTPEDRNPDRTAMDSSDPSFDLNGKMRTFFKSLEAKRASKRNAVGREKKDLVGRGSWLNYCCDRALDAHTLKDALRWQKRIVAALTGITEVIAVNEWPVERKRKVLCELRADRIRHKGNIANIETALRKNERVGWRHRD